MSYHPDPYSGEGQKVNEGAAPEQIVVKALPLLVPESVVQQDAEKKRVKKGILGGSEERFVFGKILYLPYLDFTYQYSNVNGFLSKRCIIRHGRTVVIAIRSEQLHVYDDLVSMLPQHPEIESNSATVILEVVTPI